MLSTNASVSEKSLVLDRPAIEVVVSEDGSAPLALVLPPYEDIAEISSFKNTHFSLKEWGAGEHAPVWAALATERAKLKAKYERFGHSATYLNRMANLASFEDDFDSERDYLTKAAALVDDEFISNRLIENYIVRHDDATAAKMLEKKDLDKSVYANLRLAAMCAKRSDITQASALVRQALAIDPLDFGARLFDGAINLWQGNYARAILSFKVAGDRRPNSTALHTNMAITYIRMSRPDKALRSVKMAVAIDPLNANAIVLLADMAHSRGHDEDSIPSLRYFLRFEQKNSSVWGRLARALLGLGETGEAIAALKRQASVQENSEVWNNLGVAYATARDSGRALESFKHALEISNGVVDFGFCLAARNIASTLVSSRPPAAILSFVDSVLSSRNRELFATRQELFPIFVIKLQALYKLERIEEVSRYGEEILTWHHAIPELKTVVAANLLAAYSINDADSSRALALASKLYDDFSRDPKLDMQSVRMLLNNLAFVFVENGDHQKAERCLQLISSDIHKMPYPTATSGLIHLRKGNLDKAKELYGEALRLAIKPQDKARIRQKWNLEFGRAKMALEPQQAIRHLKKANDEPDGEPGLARRAAAVLRQITRL